MHGIAAVDFIEQHISYSRRAIREREDKLLRRHVIVSKTFDQRCGGIFLGKAEFPDRDVVADHPRRHDACESNGQNQTLPADQIARKFGNPVAEPEYDSESGRQQGCKRGLGQG